jgi:hypothetical protein
LFTAALLFHEHEFLQQDQPRVVEPVPLTALCTALAPTRSTERRRVLKAMTEISSDQKPVAVELSSFSAADSVTLYFCGDSLVLRYPGYPKTRRGIMHAITIHYTLASRMFPTDSCDTIYLIHPTRVVLYAGSSITGKYHQSRADHLDPLGLSTDWDFG